MVRDYGYFSVFKMKKVGQWYVELAHTIETITDTENHAIFHYDLKYKTRFKLSKYTY